MQQNLTLDLNEPLIAPLVPIAARTPVVLLWRLHERLTGLSASGRELPLRQIRLAWWRDALESLIPDSPPAEPLLEEIASGLSGHLPVADLAALAEARRAMVDALWAPESAADYGRHLFVLSARLMDRAAPAAGGEAFGLVSAALSTAEADTSRLLAAARAAPLNAQSPRALRALDQLAARIARQHGERSRQREQLLVLRIGLFGR